MRKKSFFTAGVVGKSYIEHRRIILTVSFLTIATFILTLFSALNFFKLNHPLVGMIDGISALLTMGALVYVQKKKRFFAAALTGTLTLFIFLVSFVMINQNDSFGIIWSIFFPIFVISLLGRKLGLLMTLLFYLVVFSMAFQGIDVWEEGKWDITSFLRYTIASITLTYVIYMNEYAMEQAQKELDQKMREVAQNTKSLELLSITDPLTSFYNRRHFEDVFKEMLTHIKREEDAFIFFIYDIDFFKRYNDTYGHKAGDNALIAISKHAKTFFQREGDVLFRIGGEEFAGIVKAEDTQVAMKHIHQFCKEVASLHIIHEKNDASSYLSVSIGAVIINHKEHLDTDYLYKKADDALYEAKSLGRNRVIFAQPPL